MVIGLEVEIINQEGERIMEIIAIISVCLNVFLIIKLKRTLDKLDRVFGR